MRVESSVGVVDVVEREVVQSGSDEFLVGWSGTGPGLTRTPEPPVD